MARKPKRARAAALASNEASLWTQHAGLAGDALGFWNTFLGLRMGPSHDQSLDAGALDRLLTIIRAVCWVESKHGTAGANQPARDPMQCGNPGDAWWREVTGQLTPEDVLTRGPGLSNLRASQLPGATQSAAGFPASAHISALNDKTRGHRGADFRPSHSFYWSIPYLLHRTNVPANGRTFRCGNLSREDLIDGAVAYNGGGDPQYRAKIVQAFALIGELDSPAGVVAASVEAVHDVGSLGAAGSDPDLSRLVREIVSDLTDATGKSAAASGPALLFPGGIHLIRAKLTVGRADASTAAAEIEISGPASTGDATAGATPAATPAPTPAPDALPAPDFHEDPDVIDDDEQSVTTLRPQVALAAAAAAAEPSGPAWVARFPGSRTTADLGVDFKHAIEAFLAALAAAGATVRISATYRPPERAYLMHHAWAIARLGANPEGIPQMPGVNIAWAHRRANGQVDRPASRQAAERMVQAYGLSVQAALRSRHTERRAIDMSVSWNGTLRVADGNGQSVSVTSPRNGSNARLHAVGRTFGVIKLVSDPPHWSEDGH